MIHSLPVRILWRHLVKSPQPLHFTLHSLLCSGHMFKKKKKDKKNRFGNTFHFKLCLLYIVLPGDTMILYCFPNYKCSYNGKRIFQIILYNCTSNLCALHQTKICQITIHSSSSAYLDRVLGPAA